MAGNRRGKRRPNKEKKRERLELENKANEVAKAFQEKYGKENVTIWRPDHPESVYNLLNAKTFSRFHFPGPADAFERVLTSAKNTVNERFFLLHNSVGLMFSKDEDEHFLHNQPVTKMLAKGVLTEVTMELDLEKSIFKAKTAAKVGFEFVTVEGANVKTVIVIDRFGAKKEYEEEAKKETEIEGDNADSEETGSVIQEEDDTDARRKEHNEQIKVMIKAVKEAIRENLVAGRKNG